MKALLRDFDTRLTKDIQKWPNWVRPLMLVATLIGQPIFTVGVAMLVAGIGWGDGNRSLLVAGILAFATFVACTVLKLYFRRDRPMTEYVTKMRFDTYSMPSGHATGAVASFGLLAVLLCQIITGPWLYIFAVLVSLLIVLIGISRIYLGAHYPSDVIVGWLLGLIGLGVIMLTVRPMV